MYDRNAAVLEGPFTFDSEDATQDCIAVAALSGTRRRNNAVYAGTVCPPGMQPTRRVVASADPTTDTRFGGHLFGFTGPAFEEEMGLENNLNRWYDGEAGQWLTEDPIGFEGGDVNLGRYCGNSAEDGLDPTGLSDISPPIGGRLAPPVKSPVRVDVFTALKAPGRRSPLPKEIALLETLRSRESNRDRIEAVIKKAFELTGAIDMALDLVNNLREQASLTPAEEEILSCADKFFNSQLNKALFGTIASWVFAMGYHSLKCLDEIVPGDITPRDDPDRPPSPPTYGQWGWGQLGAIADLPPTSGKQPPALRDRPNPRLPDAVD